MEGDGGPNKMKRGWLGTCDIRWIKNWGGGGGVGLFLSPPPTSTTLLNGIAQSEHYFLLIKLKKCFMYKSDKLIKVGGIYLLIC